MTTPDIDLDLDRPSTLRLVVARQNEMDRAAFRAPSPSNLRWMKDENAIGAQSQNWLRVVA